MPGPIVGDAPRPRESFLVGLLCETAPQCGRRLSAAISSRSTLSPFPFSAFSISPFLKCSPYALRRRPRAPVILRLFAIGRSRRGDRFLPSAFRIPQLVHRTPHPDPGPVQHVSVNHCCTDIFMTQKFLHRPDIRPVLQQMRCERMTQTVTARRLIDLR